MKPKGYFWMFLRYLILLVIALPNIDLFYTLLAPITIYPAYWLISLFYSSSLAGNTILAGETPIVLANACIAGAAYYFLLILNLATPMEMKTRAKSIIFLFLSMLLFNIIRITFFSALFLNGFEYFDIAHKSVWYLGSTVFVVVLWFINVKIFSIKAIPAYTDIKTLYEESSKKR